MNTTKPHSPALVAARLCVSCTVCSHHSVLRATSSWAPKARSVVLSKNYGLRWAESIVIECGLRVQISVKFRPRSQAPTPLRKHQNQGALVSISRIRQAFACPGVESEVKDKIEVPYRAVLIGKRESTHGVSDLWNSCFFQFKI